MAIRGTTVRRPWVGTVASLALVAIGIYLLKLCVLDVLAAADRHESSVRFSLKGVLAAPAAIVLGTVAAASQLMSGDRQALARRFTNPETRRLTPLGWVVVLVLLGSGGILYVWMRAQLADKGYDV
jgi:hypothetical protein